MVILKIASCFVCGTDSLWQIVSEEAITIVSIYRMMSKQQIKHQNTRRKS